MATIPISGNGYLVFTGDGYAVLFAANGDMGRSICSHLPRGPAWDAHRGEDTELRAMLIAAGRELDRFGNAVQTFLREAVDPREAFDLLGAWEKMLGLPECGPLPISYEDRRADAYAKLTTRLETLNKSDFIVIAALLGYTVTVTEFYDKRLRVGDKIDSNKVMSFAESQFCWQVSGPAGGDDGEQDDEIFKCKFGKWIPLHTCVVFDLA